MWGHSTLSSVPSHHGSSWDNLRLGHSSPVTALCWAFRGTLSPWGADLLPFLTCCSHVPSCGGLLLMACTCSSLETAICTSQAGRWVAGFGLTEWRAPQSGGGMSTVRLFSCESFLWGCVLAHLSLSAVCLGCCLWGTALHEDSYCTWPEPCLPEDSIRPRRGA